MILGNRRTGKSHLGKWLIKNYPRYVVFDSLLEHDDLGFVVHDHLSLYRTVKDRIVYQGEDFHNVARYILTRSNIAFMVDEIELRATKHKIDPSLDRIIRHGGHANISLIGITRSTNEVHNNCLRFANYLCLFKMHFENDLKFLRNWVGEEAIAQLPYLKEHYWICYDLETHTWAIYSPIPLRHRRL